MAKKELPKQILYKGNMKLDRSVFTWSMTPVKSCKNNKLCKKTCYAKKAMRLYPNVKAVWDRNYNLAKKGEFKRIIIKQLARSYTCKIVRLHVAGDFFSQSYIDQWAEIIDIFPELKFYTYTKVYDMFDFSEIEKYKNINIINSITDQGLLNFGDKDYISELENQGYICCPYSYNHNIICGKDCQLCLTHKKICFLKH